MLQLYIFVSFGVLFGIVIIILQSMLLQICSVVYLLFDFLLLCFLFQSYRAPETGLVFFVGFFWLFFLAGGRYFCCFVSPWLFCLFVGGSFVFWGWIKHIWNFSGVTYLHDALWLWELDSLSAPWWYHGLTPGANCTTLKKHVLGQWFKLFKMCRYQCYLTSYNQNLYC